MIRHMKIGLVGTGMAPRWRRAVFVAVILAPCGASAQEAPSSTQGSATPRAQEAAGTEPEFKPGIPGLKMVDVRDHKHLWREIEELQSWEYGDRISVSEYRSKVIEKTSHFLGLGGAAAGQFATTVSATVASIRESFQKRQGGEPGDMEAKFSADLGAAVTRVTSLLRREPRHQLFEPDCKQWLLQLAFGPSEAKEAREARQAQAKK